MSPEAPVNSRTAGERQQLELLRLLAPGIRLLILDEPTTGISSAQKEVLYSGALSGGCGRGRPAD